MDLQQLFSDFMEAKAKFDDLSKEVAAIKGENPLNIRHPNEEVSLNDAQQIVNKVLQNKNKFSELEKAQKVLSSAHESVTSAVALVDKRIRIHYIGNDYVVYIENGTLKIQGYGFKNDT